MSEGGNDTVLGPDVDRPFYLLLAATGEKAI
jgi:hypothetical protein